MGVILFELFTGERRFTGTTPAELQASREQASSVTPSSLVEGFDPAVDLSVGDVVTLSSLTYVRLEQEHQGVRVEGADVVVRSSAVGAAALGGPIFMPDAQVDRIAGRTDEHYRQRVMREFS